MTAEEMHRRLIQETRDDAVERIDINLSILMWTLRLEIGYVIDRIKGIGA